MPEAGAAVAALDQTKLSFVGIKKATHPGSINEAGKAINALSIVCARALACLYANNPTGGRWLLKSYFVCHSMEALLVSNKPEPAAAVLAATALPLSLELGSGSRKEESGAKSTGEKSQIQLRPFARFRNACHFIFLAISSTILCQNYLSSLRGFGSDSLNPSRRHTFQFQHNNIYGNKFFRPLVRSIAAAAPAVRFIHLDQVQRSIHRSIRSIR